MPDPASVVRGLIEAFSAQREEDMRAALAEDMTAYVTNAEGGVDRVHGRDSYVRRLLALKAPVLSVTVTQSVTVTAQAPLLRTTESTVSTVVNEPVAIFARAFFKSSAEVS